MSLNKYQFKELIEKTLRIFDPVLLSPQAVKLQLITAAVESGFGTHLRQLGGGPALGFFQMEPGTFRWLKRVYQTKYPELIDRLPEELEWDIRLAIIMARLRYRIVPEALPGENDIQGMAAHWKEYYNTSAGAGKVMDFIEAYQRYVK